MKLTCTALGPAAHQPLTSLASVSPAYRPFHPTLTHHLPPLSFLQAQSALACFEKAEKMDPKNAMLYSQRGQVRRTTTKGAGRGLDFLRRG